MLDRTRWSRKVRAIKRHCGSQDFHPNLEHFEGYVRDITQDDLGSKAFSEELQSLQHFWNGRRVARICSEEVAMLVRDLMTRDVSSCSPENSLAELAKMMLNHRCGALPIVDGSGRVTGIITDRDICIALGTKNLKASEVLTREVSSRGCVGCSSDNDVRDALRTMATEEVSRLPVIDEAGHLVGILSIDDIIFRAGGGHSCLSDREIIDTMRAMREERIHQLDVVNQDGSNVRSDIRMPLHYEHIDKRR
jgi:CBS domain-containing protein